MPGLRSDMSFFLCLLDGGAALDGGTAAGVWLSVTDLQPYTNYSFWIRGCNTQGCIESLPRNVTTLPAGTDTANKTPAKRKSYLFFSSLGHNIKKKCCEVLNVHPADALQWDNSKLNLLFVK